MTPSRILSGLLGGLVILILLAFIAHSAAPGLARAFMSPPDIVKGGILGEPGTPYEEPENGPSTGPTDPKSPEGIIGGTGGAPVVTPDTIPAPASPQIDRQWLFLRLQAWGIHLMVLLRF